MDNNKITGESGQPKKKVRRDASLGSARAIYEWVELFALSICFVLLVLILLGRHSPVDGTSMINTLQDKDLLIISDLFYTPKQGDIIVFENKQTGYDRPYVKRIVATEGQTVSIDEANNKVLVDGEPLDEPYAYYSDDYGLLKGMFFSDKDSYTLKEGEVFALGDNRCNSRDSRTIGPVDVRSIVGRVIIRAFPFKSFGTVD